MNTVLDVEKNWNGLTPMMIRRRMILRLVKFLLSLTNEPYAVVYKIPHGWKAYICCPPYESIMNGINNAWKFAMADERKKLTKAYRKEQK